MSSLVERLSRRGTQTEGNLPEAIFGTAGTLNSLLQSNALPIRIGLWPIVSDQSPQVAMGLQAVLGYLLADYFRVHVYHLLAKVDGLPEDYTWTMAQSQFVPDDWTLEDMDDNVRLWGDLTQELGNWTLALSVESSSGLDVYECVGASIGKLMDDLAEGVEEIAEDLGAGDQRTVISLPSSADLDETAIQQALEGLFTWELNLYLDLWGQPWSQDRAAADLKVLLDASRSLAAPGAWLCAQAVARFAMYADRDLSDAVWPLMDAVSAVFPDSSIVTAILAEALLYLDEPEQAQNLYEAQVESEQADATAYLVLAVFFQRRGHYEEAIDSFQSAIEAEKVSAELYRRYAELLVLLDYSGVPVTSFVLIDPDEVEEDTVLWEVVESYDEAITLDPEDITLLSSQITHLVDIGPDDERLWRRFRTLVALDEDNEQVESLIDTFYNLEDLAPGIAILKEALEREPERMDHYLNLAAMYVVDEQGDAAQDVLRKAGSLNPDDEVKTEIERLMLLAEDPDFELRLGELSDIINAGNELPEEDVEYLESVLKRVPTFAEIYLLVARAYMAWDEAPAALETLLDGHRNLPNDPDILALLIETLWDSDEQELAFSYLKKGLEANPNHVPLLALAGRCLFEDGQLEQAKVYLARAETISPRHPALAEARRRIAGAI